MELIPDLTRTIEVDAIELPANGTSLDLLQQVYRNPSLPLLTRIRAAGMALSHEHPKLAVVATVDGNNDFAAQLDQAVERSRRVSPTMVEGKPMIEEKVSSSDTKTLSNGKPMIPDRRYRRW
jgi:hypothetical protein